jgi:hypothetical protein
MSLFGFKSKKGEVLYHWISFIDGFNYPSLEFYTSIEKALVARNIPSLSLSRVEWAEGGILSGKRVYLRMLRERLAFDTCAAPFGRGYFFSCRTVYIPPVIELWHVIAILGILAAVYAGLSKVLGIAYGWIALVCLILAVVQVFRNTIALGLSDLDAVLINTPVIGPIYELSFRKDTYFRQDTRLVYLEVIPKLVKELAEELVASKGVKLIEQYENAPVFGALYKPVRPKTESAIS